MERSPIFRIAKEEWEASGGTRRENALSRRKSFRLDVTAASSNGRKQGDIILFPRDIPVLGEGYLVHARCNASYCEFIRRYTGQLLASASRDVPILAFLVFRWRSDEDRRTERARRELISLSTTIDVYGPRYVWMIGERISFRLLVSTVNTTSLEVKFVR